MNLCKTCGTICPFDDERTECDAYAPMTNENWFIALPTKEKAEWLDKVAENCCQICDKENRELCRANIDTGCKFENAEKWELWLKQPHRGGAMI